MALRKFATLGGVSIAALALIGAGAAATFTQNTDSSQEVNSGTMNVTLSGAGTLSNSNRTLTFAAFGPTNSSFTTGDKLVTITNNSDITVQEITEQIGATGDAALISQLFVCEVSMGPSGYVVIYNGLLSGGLTQQAIAGNLAPLATDSYMINVYAGQTVNTACGAVTTIGAAAPAVATPNPAATAGGLTNAVQGKSAVVSVTVGYSG